MEAFKKAGNTLLSPIKTELGDALTFEELRIVQGHLEFLENKN